MTKEEKTKALKELVASRKPKKAKYKVGNILYSDNEEEFYLIESIKHYDDGDVYYEGKFFDCMGSLDDEIFTEAEHRLDRTIPEDVEVVSAKRAKELVFELLMPGWFD